MSINLGENNMIEIEGENNNMIEIEGENKNMIEIEGENKNMIEIEGENKNMINTIDRHSVSYIIYSEGINIYAKNGNTGNIDYSGSDVVTVIQKAINNLTAGRTWKEKIVAKGNLSITTKLKLPSYTILEVQGKFVLANNTNQTMISESDPINGNTQIEIIGGEYDGNRLNNTTGSDGIAFSKITNSYFKNMNISNFSRDGFVLDINCQNNYIDNCRAENNIYPFGEDGDGFVNRGIENHFSNCIGKDNSGDNFLIKSRRSTYVNCKGIGSKEGSGFAITSEAGGQNSIDYNQLIGVEAYNNATEGIIVHAMIGNNVPVEYNYIQGISHDNIGAGCWVHGDLYNRYNKFDVIVENNKGGEAGFYVTSYQIVGTVANIITRNNIGAGFFTKGNYGSFIILSSGNSNEGIQIQGSDNIFSVTVNDNGEKGVLINTGNGNIITGVIFNNGKTISSPGVDILDGNRNYVNVISYDDQIIPTQSHGIRERNGIGSSDNNIIVGCNVWGNALAQISRIGTNSIVEHNIGYKTENSVLSGTFAIDSTGVKTITVSHGLAITPELKDCQLAIVQNTIVDDWSCGFVKIVRSDAKRVIAKIRITTASTTKGATAKLTLKIC